MKHFTQLKDIGRNGVQQLLARAQEFKRMGNLPPLLKGKSLAMLFQNPSLRSRASFEMAMHRLGGHAIALDPGAVWNLEWEDDVRMDGDKPEHVKEAAGVLSRYVDILGVRAFSKGTSFAEEDADAALMAFKRHAGVPVISLESAREHPCQGLADLMTIEESFGQTEGIVVTITWAPHIKPLPRAVPNSALLTAAAMGCEVRVAHPPGYELSPSVWNEAQELAKQSRAKVKQYSSQSEAINGAHVVIAKAWGSADENAPPPSAAALKHWMLTEMHFAACTDETIFLHCLPVRRNVEVSSEVLDGMRSRELDEAENRLWVQMAALERAISR